MPAIASGILRVATFQEKARLLVTFLVEVVKQARVSSFRQLGCERVKAFEHLSQVGFGIRRPHRLYGLIQVD